MFNLLPILTEVGRGYNEFFAQGMAYIAAAIAIMTAASVSLGQGMVAAKALEAVGRQPEASGKITVSMIVGQVMVETSGIYALIVALILASK